jgi:hypothetical protein
MGCNLFASSPILFSHFHQIKTKNKEKLLLNQLMTIFIKCVHLVDQICLYFLFSIHLKILLL